MNSQRIQNGGTKNTTPVGSGSKQHLNATGTKPSTISVVTDPTPTKTWTTPSSKPRAKRQFPPRGQPNYEETEDAYRFGYGARSQYRQRYSNWDDRLESQLKQDWNETYNDRDWARYRDSIRRGWDYEEGQGFRKAA